MRRNRRRSKQIVKPELQTIVETPVVTMVDTRTMSELLQAPTEGYGDAIVIPLILAENFELKDERSIDTFYNVFDHIRCQKSSLNAYRVDVMTTSSRKSPSLDVTLQPEIVKELVHDVTRLLNQSYRETAIERDCDESCGRTAQSLLMSCLATFLVGRHCGIWGGVLCTAVGTYNQVR
ncbi:hypothetical protein Tco_0821399 [Tanacetum coccineum]|uniref:Reverse transcriptase domain-containing protein n=1 Tax=Tanacetum coccineum TaxID=301880 RepID=A0ABQ4X522_9ASTR